jgi:hypothetical protein
MRGALRSRGAEGMVLGGGPHLNCHHAAPRGHPASGTRLSAPGERLMTRDVRAAVGMAHRRQPPRTATTMSSAFRATNAMITSAPTRQFRAAMSAASAPWSSRNGEGFTGTPALVAMAAPRCGANTGRTPRGISSHANGSVLGWICSTVIAEGVKPGDAGREARP